MGRQCRGSKRDGSQCTATVVPPQTYCWWHDPANAEQRRRSASKAGKAKSSREIISIKQRLSDLADDVLANRIDRGTGAVVSQILGIYLRALGTEIKLRESEEFAARLSEIEEYIETQGSSRTWG